MLSFSWDSHQRSLIFFQKHCIYSHKRPPNKSSGWQAHLQQAPVTTLSLLLGILAACELWTAKHEEKTKMGEEMQLLGGHILSFFLQLSSTEWVEQLTFSTHRKTSSVKKNWDNHACNMPKNMIGKCMNSPVCKDVKRWQRAVFKASTFPRGDFEGNFKAHFCEICTWGEAGIQVCSDMMTELQLFSPNGFSAK